MRESRRHSPNIWHVCNIDEAGQGFPVPASPQPPITSHFKKHVLSEHSKTKL